MDQAERLDYAKVYSLFSAVLAIVGFLSVLGVFIRLLSTWVALWVYLIIAALAVASFVLGYIARRDLIDLGVYKQSNFYQGAAVISLGCSPFTLLILAGLLYLAVASVR